MIAVTGATGHLGRLVVESLEDRGVEPHEIVAAVRSPKKADDLAERGVEVRRADYDEPETLGEAFDGVDRLLLISSNEIGRRADQHRTVIDAAKEAGVGFIAYTSGPYADRSPMKLMTEHKATEEKIRSSGIPYAILRNGWYMENYTATLDQVLEHGAVLGSAGDGKISGATRADLAEAAAVVISGDGHEGAVYELGGDEAFTMSEFAEDVSEQSGQDVVYRDLPPEEYTEALVGAGLPESYAAALADSDAAAADGWLHIETGDLSRLIGHPTTDLSEALSEALEVQPEEA